MATQIFDVDDLRDINDDLHGDYELANNIDCGGGSVVIGYWSLADPGYPTFQRTEGAWTYYLHGFLGHFDGKGRTIFNVVNAAIPDPRYLGLFRAVMHGGVVEKVTLSNVSMDGERYIGCLAGYAYGGVGAIPRVSKCRVAEGQVNGTGDAGALIGQTYDAEIEDCSAEADVEATGNIVGGLVGYAYGGTINRCSSQGSAKGNRYVGGLAGMSYSPISRCYSLVDVEAVDRYAGGFVSFNSDQIDNSYSRGQVEGDRYVGGFVGRNQAAVLNCFSAGVVVGVNDVGGFCGWNSWGPDIAACFWDTQTSGQAASQGGEGKTTTEMMRYSTFRNAGWNIGRTYRANPNDGYPFLSWQVGRSPVWLLTGGGGGWIPGPGPKPAPPAGIHGC